MSEGAIETIERHLKDRERRRDDLHARARQLRRQAQTAMTHLHDRRATPEELAALRKAGIELSRWLRAEGRGEEALALDALQEYVEASLLEAIVRGRPLPTHEALHVDPEPYLLGLGDLVGEVRRLALEALTRHDVNGASRYLGLMEALFHTLMRFDTARSIVALKPKQDTARSLLEKTRGEVTMAHVLHRATHATRPPVRRLP